jgi:chromate reductase, NAD(P)H dehydrogenase (quinone)
MPLNVAVLVGSLRSGSFTRRIAKATVALSPGGASYTFLEIGDLPLYNQDLDEPGQTPAAWTAFRDRMRSIQAVLFATPEYNRSVPAALKNAIDVGSRPYGQSVWDGKPAAILSVSPGAIGGFGANHHLRQSLVFLNMPPLQQPEAYVGHAADVVADDFTVDNENVRAFLGKFIAAFEIFAAKLAPAA